MATQSEITHLKAKGKSITKLGRPDDDQIYRASMFASIYAEFVQTVYGSEAVVTKETFVALLSTKAKWLLDPTLLRLMVS